MIGVAEARAAILSSAEPVGVENVRLRDALGRTLREDLMATRDQPPFRASAMDGYAVRASDTPGPLRLIGEAGAGKALQVPIGAGECARIFTGAPLPSGADAILIQEDAACESDMVTAPAVATGRHVRDAGVDFRSGDRVLAAGLRLDAISIALAAALGRASLTVSSRPCVAILGGGDELVTPPLGGTILGGVTRDSVLTLVREWGLQANERAIGMEELIHAHRAGTLGEVFGCGTAAVITPVGALGWKGEDIVINDSKPGELAQRLYTAITDIQYGRAPDTHNWMTLLDE